MVKTLKSMDNDTNVSLKWATTEITTTSPQQRTFWKSGANLSCYHLIFDDESICTQKDPSSAKVNYSFNWKLKGDRALILPDLDSLMAIFNFSHLSGVNWGQIWTKNSNFGWVLSL